MRKLICKLSFNPLFSKVISSNFKNIQKIEIIDVLKENTAKGENIGISKITFKEKKQIDEFEFSKYFKVLDVIEENSTEYICLVKVSTPKRFLKLLKFMDLEIVWDKPIIITEDQMTYSCIGSSENLQNILKFSKLLGKITAVSYDDANYKGYNLLSNLTLKEKEILLDAIKKGYYEYPRKISATKLADGLDNSKSTVIEHLRKAENKIILSTVKSTQYVGE